MNKEDILFNKIKITKDMLDYNIGNILRNEETDPYIDINKNNFLNNKKYRNTILGIYYNLPIVKDNIKEKYRGSFLKLAIEKYIRDNKNLKFPTEDELVVYFRLGDHPINMYGRGIEDPIYYNEIKLKIINSLKEKKYKKMTIVCNLSFTGNDKQNITKNIKNTEFYNFFQIDKILNKKNIDFNKKFFIPALKDMLNTFNHLKIDIFSNDNPDIDICYLYKNGFIGSKENTWTNLLNFNKI